MFNQLPPELVRIVAGYLSLPDAIMKIAALNSRFYQKIRSSVPGKVLLTKLAMQELGLNDLISQLAK